MGVGEPVVADETEEAFRKLNLGSGNFEEVEDEVNEEVDDFLRKPFGFENDF